MGLSTAVFGGGVKCKLLSHSPNWHLFFLTTPECSTTSFPHELIFFLCTTSNPKGSWQYLNLVIPNFYFSTKSPAYLDFIMSIEHSTSSLTNLLQNDTANRLVLYKKVSRRSLMLHTDQAFDARSRMWWTPFFPPLNIVFTTCFRSMYNIPLGLETRDTREFVNTENHPPQLFPIFTHQKSFWNLSNVFVKHLLKKIRTLLNIKSFLFYSEQKTVL